MAKKNDIKELVTEFAFLLDAYEGLHRVIEYPSNADQELTVSPVLNQLNKRYGDLVERAYRLKLVR